MIQPYERAINYYETDQMAIVHHSNYIRYMEETRMYYMKQLGLPYEFVEEQGILIPVLGVNVEYKKAIRFGDTVLISECMDQFSQVKFSIQYEIRNKQTGELHATGSSKHCFVDRNLVPVRLKKNYPEIYEKFETMIENNKNNEKK